MQMIADRFWRKNDVSLGIDWDSEILMEVHGNASSLVLNNPLPDAVLEWLNKDEKRQVVFLPECNITNVLLRDRVTTSDGREPPQVIPLTKEKEETNRLAERREELVNEIQRMEDEIADIDSLSKEE